MVTLLQSLGLVAPETIASLAVERLVNSRGEQVGAIRAAAGVESGPASPIVRASGS
jgi:hypothetical protein